jgi:hypothetical protein
MGNEIVMLETLRNRGVNVQLQPQTPTTNIITPDKYTVEKCSNDLLGERKVVGGPIVYIDGILCNEKCGKHGTLIRRGYMFEFEPEQMKEVLIMMAVAMKNSQVGEMFETRECTYNCAGELKFTTRSDRDKETEEWEHTVNMLSEIDSVLQDYMISRARKYPTPATNLGEQQPYSSIILAMSDIRNNPVVDISKIVGSLPVVKVEMANQEGLLR